MKHHEISTKNRDQPLSTRPMRMRARDAMLTVREYMSKAPITVTPDQSLLYAQTLMEDNNIRQVPVLERDELCGILALRDIAYMSGPENLDLARLRVEHAMSTYVYTVSSETSLAVAADQMAQGNLGSVVVTDGGRVIGILTTVDVCRALAKVLGQTA